MPIAILSLSFSREPDATPPIPTTARRPAPCAPCGVTVDSGVRCIHGGGHGRTVGFSANLEHDLRASRGRDSLERRPGLRERKNRVDLRVKLACVHERSQLQQLLAVGFDDEVDRARHLLCDRDHALASETSPPRVSKTNRPDALHDRCAGMSRKLDGDVPNPARGARDQHPLASGEPLLREQVLRAVQPAHRQSCRLDVAQPQGLRCKHIGRDDGVLANHTVAIERRERIYLVSVADDKPESSVRRNPRQSIDRKHAPARHV